MKLVGCYSWGDIMKTTGLIVALCALLQACGTETEVQTDYRWQQPLPTAGQYSPQPEPTPSTVQATANTGFGYDQGPAVAPAVDYPTEPVQPVQPVSTDLPQPLGETPPPAVATIGVCVCAVDATGCTEVFFLGKQCQRANESGELEGVTQEECTEQLCRQDAQASAEEACAAESMCDMDSFTLEIHSVTASWQTR